MIAAAVLAALVCLGVSPYAARLTRTVPDRADRRWYLGATPPRSVLLATAAVTVVLGLFAAAGARWSALLPAYVVFAVIAAVLVVVDAEHHRLPNRLLYPAAASALVLLAVAAWVRGDWSAYLRALEAAAVVYVVFLALALVSPKSLGLGDVRLAAVLALFLGFRSWPLVYVGLFAGFLLGAVVRWCANCWSTFSHTMHLKGVSHDAVSSLLRPPAAACGGMGVHVREVPTESGRVGHPHRRLRGGESRDHEVLAPAGADRERAGPGPVLGVR